MERQNKKQLEIYFHIPFCVRKCLYCDFLSAPAEREVREAYMKALSAEVEGRADEYRNYQVSSVFVGGGTPSTVDAALMSALLRKVRERFFVSEDAEITVEVNPGTVDRECLRTYLTAGVNRLSIGLESASDKELRTLGRIHSYEQFLDTYEEAVSAGFPNINVDLMYALPGQTKASFRRTLEKVLSLTPRPAHFSVYSLIVEEGTFFYSLREQGKLDLPDEDCEWQMGVDAERLLDEAGYRRYEISNYACAGYECRHNCGYWRRRDYVGFGLGAASLLNNVRFCNGKDLRAYLDAPLGCRGEEQKLGIREQMEEFMFLGLRMLQGVSRQVFEENFGKSMEEVYGGIIRRNCEAGLLYEYKDRTRKEDFLALTKRGLEVSNYVMSQFLFD